MKAKASLPFLFLISIGLVLLDPLSALAAEAPSSSPFSPALTPPLTPAQAMTIQEAVRKGELTPEVRQLIESNPEWKKLLPPKWREELETEESGRELGLDNTMLQRLKKRAEKEKKEKEEKEEEEEKEREKKLLAKRYDWKKSVYVSRLFLSRLQKEEAKEVTHFGPMYVAGKTFGELKTFLRSKVGAIAEVRADISLGELKGFLVSLLGEVKLPGRYHVTSFHTALQAITLAEGIRDIGSFRRVQVKRGAETVDELDIYDFLLRGDIAHDIRLQAGDAVFVPVAGPMVAVVGEVRRQSIYELKEEKTIREVLAMAGGLSPSAYKRRVRVERLEGNLARRAVSLHLEEIEKSLSSFGLQDGDILRILSVLPEEENVVQVEGHVQRPGKYEWKPGLTVGSLIPT